MSALTEGLEPDDVRTINRIIAVVHSVSFKVNGLLWDVGVPPLEQLAEDLGKALRHLNNTLARLEPHCESLDAIQQEFEVVDKALWGEFDEEGLE